MGYKSNEFSRTSLYDRVKKLLVSYEWSDCSFFISGKDFKAHKLILGISSPVFEAMFYGPLSSNNSIEITDIEPDIFQLLLNYIYTDTVELSSIEEAFELLYASRKYMVDQLNELCIAYIEANISIDNVTTILNYPEFMHDKTLFSSALQLFCGHAKYLLQKNKKHISISCMKSILESNQINIEEKDLIIQVFDWTAQYCGGHDTLENRRNKLKNSGIFKLLRFFTLSLEELDEILRDQNNILLPYEADCIKNLIKDPNNILDKDLLEILDTTSSKRNSLKLECYLCHRSSIKSAAPILIDSSNYTVYSRIKVNKSVFLTSLSVPTRMAPIINFRNNTVKAYSEQIAISVINESDNKIIKFTNFMNTVDYDSTVDIDLQEPCYLKKDKWYKVIFLWPQNRFHMYSYVVECRDRFYTDLKVQFQFEDSSITTGNSGGFLIGLKYCL